MRLLIVAHEEHPTGPCMPPRQLSYQFRLRIPRLLSLNPTGSPTNGPRGRPASRQDGTSTLVCLFINTRAARTKKLITITVVTCIGFFSVALIFFGLTLGASTLNMNPFAYVAISGVVELIAFATIPMVEIYGRRKSGISTFAVCAVSLLLQPLIPAGLSWLSITLVMVGKMASSCAFDVMFLYSSELYPTEIRTQGVSAGMMASRAGAFIAPFIMSALEVHHSWAISVVFGLTASVAAVSFLPLWETRNTCLPDTVKQLHTPTGVSTHVSCDSSTSETPSCRETVTSC